MKALLGSIQGAIKALGATKALSRRYGTNSPRALRKALLRPFQDSTIKALFKLFGAIKTPT
eukprot:00036_6